MPDLTTDDLMMVLNAVDLQSEARIWRATTQDGSAGHPIVFHRSLLPKLTALVGDSGGQAVVKQNAHHTVYIALPDQHARTDLDTPEAWAEWKLQNALIN
jgi:CTP:molybdopterin cytidylyltransferase MocA